MFLSCNITLSKVSCVQIWIDSAYMAWIMICMLFFNLFTFVYYLLVRSCYQVVLKLRGSCLLRVALKHPQSLCLSLSTSLAAMRELVHVQGGQMSDIGLYACKIDVCLSSWRIFFAMHSCLLCLLSLTYLKHLQASCGHVVACGCTILACEASAETRLVPSSGKSSQMSTALTPTGTLCQSNYCILKCLNLADLSRFLRVSFCELKSKSSSEMSNGTFVKCQWENFATLILIEELSWRRAVCLVQLSIDLAGTYHGDSDLQLETCLIWMHCRYFFDIQNNRFFCTQVPKKAVTCPNSVKLEETGSHFLASMLAQSPEVFFSNIV